MATSVINDRQRDFILKSYTHKYTAGVDSRYNLTASNFGITQISGYTPVAIPYVYSGGTSVSARGVALLKNFTSASNVMYIYNKSSSTASNITARIDILWMRDDLVQE